MLNIYHIQYIIHSESYVGTETPEDGGPRISNKWYDTLLL
jgi:hypothetical protein